MLRTSPSELPITCKQVCGEVANCRLNQKQISLKPSYHPSFYLMKESTLMKVHAICELIGSSVAKDGAFALIDR